MMLKAYWQYASMRCVLWRNNVLQVPQCYNYSHIARHIPILQLAFTALRLSSNCGEEPVSERVRQEGRRDFCPDPSSAHRPLSALVTCPEAGRPIENCGQPNIEWNLPVRYVFVSSPLWDLLPQSGRHPLHFFFCPSELPHPRREHGAIFCLACFCATRLCSCHAI